MSGSKSSTGAKRERRRRSHIRTFTGCLQCRQRHVKCDETRPTCANCSRMKITCSAYSFIIDMQVSTPRSLEAAKRRKNASAVELKRSRSAQSNTKDDCSSNKSSLGEGSEVSLPLSAASYTFDHHAVKAEDDGDETIPGQLILKPRISPQAGTRALLKKPHDDPLEPQSFLFESRETHTLLGQSRDLLSSTRDAADEQFLSNFLINVSALLVVYDRPHNANPFRFFFPFMAATSAPLRDVMNALGAMHLANTQTPHKDLNLEVMAIARYTRAVEGLRKILSSGVKPTISDLATCLLLIFFDMMDSSGDSWKLHLVGAKQIYEGLCLESDYSHASGSADALEAALRIFLVSTLGYLDVSASASSAQKTQLSGAYWAYPAGWQYNLGVPALSKFSREAHQEECDLQYIREMKSALMLIQSDIGSLAERTQAGLNAVYLNTEAEMILSRLQIWQDQAPEIFQGLGNHVNYHADSVEAAVSVRACHQATIIYLHQVLEGSMEILTIQQLIDSILSAFQKHAHNVRQFGMLWAFFIAGSATGDVYQQTFVRSRLQSMRSFGMKNVDLAMEVLEIVWERRKQGFLETRWFILQKELPFTLLLT